LGSLTAYIVVNRSYQHRRYRFFRLCVFIATGLSAFVPIFHATLLFPLNQLKAQSGLLYYCTEGALILLGALFYITRLPECLWPGRFDIWGSSHQIFHCLVVVATVVHLEGVLSAFEWNYRNRRCAL
jgi:adiponectin receptor